MMQQIKKAERALDPFDVIFKSMPVHPWSKIEENVLMQPEDYKPTFYRTYDPVRDRRSASGLL